MRAIKEGGYMEENRIITCIKNETEFLLKPHDINLKGDNKVDGIREVPPNKTEMAFELNKNEAVNKTSGIIIYDIEETGLQLKIVWDGSFSFKGNAFFEAEIIGNEKRKLFEIIAPGFISHDKVNTLVLKRRIKSEEVKAFNVWNAVTRIKIW